MIERLEIVGADSISALEQSICMESQRVDMESQRVDMESQRVDMESTPTQYKYNRKSLRLKHYDYSREGYYFITVTTQNRGHLFGRISDGVMVLNVAGEMVNELWYDIPNDFDHVILHDFVIMPNHVHGIIEITKYDKPVEADSISALEQSIHMESQKVDMESQRVDMESQRVDMESQRVDMESQRVDMESTPTQYNMESKQRADMESAPTLSTILQSFKRHTTLRYIKMVKNNTLPPFQKRIWQRNFYEHVVRDEKDYARIVEYIQNNETTWENDILNNP